MTDSIFTAKISALLEDEDPLIRNLIFETIKEIDEKPISVQAHVQNMKRYLDTKMKEGNNH